jgi:hypothetical protein
MADDRLDEAASKLLAEAEKHGIAITPVKQGFLMVFTKAHILGILGKIEASGADKAIVLVQDRKTVN